MSFGQIPSDASFTNLAARLRNVTGTITANEVDANTIEAGSLGCDEIDAVNITADVINADSLTVDGQVVTKGASPGATIYVVSADNDTEYPTIQSAVDAAESALDASDVQAAVVLVRAGTYAEDVAVTRSMTITASGSVTLVGTLSVDLSDDPSKVFAVKGLTFNTPAGGAYSIDAVNVSILTVSEAYERVVFDSPDINQGIRVRQAGAGLQTFYVIYLQNVFAERAEDDVSFAINGETGVIYANNTRLTGIECSGPLSNDQTLFYLDACIVSGVVTASLPRMLIQMRNGESYARYVTDEPSNHTLLLRNTLVAPSDSGGSDAFNFPNVLLTNCDVTGANLSGALVAKTPDDPNESNNPVRSRVVITNCKVTDVQQMFTSDARPGYVSLRNCSIVTSDLALFSAVLSNGVGPNFPRNGFEMVNCSYTNIDANVIPDGLSVFGSFERDTAAIVSDGDLIEVRISNCNLYSNSLALSGTSSEISVIGLTNLPATITDTFLNFPSLSDGDGTVAVVTVSDAAAPKPPSDTLLSNVTLISDPSTTPIMFRQGVGVTRDVTLTFGNVLSNIATVISGGTISTSTLVVFNGST